MRHMIDLSGQTFGRLTVLRLAEDWRRQGRNICWVCKCACGNEAVVAGRHLRSGNTKSCGCLSGTTRTPGHYSNATNNNNTSTHPIGLTDQQLDALLDSAHAVPFECRRHYLTLVVDELCLLQEITTLAVEQACVRAADRLNAKGRKGNDNDDAELDRRLRA